MTSDNLDFGGMGLHGQAVITALDLLKEIRHERPTRCDVARRLAIAPGRLEEIFPDDESLLIAIGEQALIRLIDAATKSVVKVPQDDAVGQFIALGEAFIVWVVMHPVQYRLISDEVYLGPDATARLRRYLDSLDALMERMLRRAQSAGLLDPAEDIRLIVLSSRIFASGMAQMLVDSRLANWDCDTTAIQTARRAMQHFVLNFARGYRQRSPMSGAGKGRAVSAGH